MTRETNTTRLPDASEDRIIECPVCSSVITKTEAESVYPLPPTASINRLVLR